MLVDLSSKDYIQLRQVKHDEVETAMTFAFALFKLRYDAVHQTVNINVDDHVYLKLHQSYIISELTNRKLSNQRVGLFEVLKRIKNIAFRLKLSLVMSIHSVIFIAQIKPAAKKPDSYNRILNTKPLAVEKKSNNSAPYYEIEKLLNKRISRGQLQYLVKWLRYEAEHNV